MAVIAEVFQQDAYFSRRREVKLVALEIERVLVGADQVRDQVFVRRAVIENFDVLGGLDEDLGRLRAAKAGYKKEGVPQSNAGLH